MAQSLGENLAINIGVNVTGLPQVQQVQTRMTSLNKTIQKSTSQYNANAVATNKWAKGALQQAGYQVGDFAVQIANGTSAIQAFGQQGSQLLGIFGPIGAVLGAVVAIGSAVGLAFNQMGGGAKQASEDIIGLSSALGDVEASAKMAGAEFDAYLSKHFEAAETQIKSLVDRLEGVRLQALQQSIGQLLDESASKIETLRSEFDEISADIGANLKEIMTQGPGMAGARAALQNALDDAKMFRLEFGLTTNEFQIFLDNMERVKKAQTFEELVNEIARMEAHLARVDEGALTNFRNKLVELLAKQGVFDRIADAAAETGENADAAAGKVSRLSGAIGLAAAQARRLVENLRRAPLAIMDLADQTAIMQAEVSAINAGYGETASKVAAYRKELEIQYGLVNAQAPEHIQQITETINKQVALKEEQLRVNAALVQARDKFNEVGTAGGAAMSQIKTSTDNALGSLDKMFTELDATVGNISKTIEDSLTSGFMAMVDGTKTAKDAFRDMAKAIIAELYKVLVVQQLVGSVKAGTGLAGAIGGALGFSGARASGGQVTANKAYLVGERGPEMLVPSRNAHVIPNSKMGGGGGPVQVVYQFQGGVTEADLGRALPLLVERTKREVVDAVQRGGSVARVFR